MNNRKKPELLVPAGNLEKLKMAIHYGADAVYLAGKSYSLRNYAGNFTPSEMIQGIELARQNGAKVYVAVNIYPRNEDLDKLPEYLKQLSEIGIDAVIISDLGLFDIVKQTTPDLPVHISTQANNTNWGSAQFWQKSGASRVGLARELSLKEIKEIREKVKVELEIFVHGAMCISYSGRCLLSNYLAYRDANRGECAHSCRWEYRLVEEERPGEYLPIYEDERGTYILNSKDLCTIEHIPELIESGIDSFKIEGRMKSVNYLINTTRIYRQAIDAYLNNPEKYKYDPQWLEELKKVSHRHYTSGFYFGLPDKNNQYYPTSSYLRTYDFVGVVKEILPDHKIKILVKNKIEIGDELEFVGRQMKLHLQKIDKIYNEDGERQEVAQPNQTIVLEIKVPLQVNDLIRRKRG